MSEFFACVRIRCGNGNITFGIVTDFTGVERYSIHLWVDTRRVSSLFNTSVVSPDIVKRTTLTHESSFENLDVF